MWISCFSYLLLASGTPSEKEVALVLNQEVTKNKDLPWPISKAGDPDSVAVFKGNYKVSIHLPSKKTLIFATTRLVLTQLDGRLLSAYVDTKECSAKEALLEMQKNAKALKIETQKGPMELLRRINTIPETEQRRENAWGIVEYRVGAQLEMFPRLFADDRNRWTVGVELHFFGVDAATEYDSWGYLELADPTLWKELTNANRKR